MATNTKNFNFKKPDESDFYSIQDQNGNWDLADEELQKLNEPAFEDYTTGTSVPSAATALEALKSKIKLPIWMSNVVAFCKGCCTLAMIVNNCVSSDADKPLAAAQGKVLQDQLTKLYSDLDSIYTQIMRRNNTYVCDTTDDGIYLFFGKRGTDPIVCIVIKNGGTVNQIKYLTQISDAIVAQNNPQGYLTISINDFVDGRIISVYLHRFKKV